MQSRGDEQLRLALLHSVRQRPLDVVDILRELRKRVPGLIRGREGVLHPLLFRALQQGDVSFVGTSSRGLSLYGPEAKHATKRDEPAHGLSPQDERPLPAPIAPARQRAVLHMARVVKDPYHRGRVVRDMHAHMADLDALPSGNSHRFGSKKAIQAALQRVSRGKRTVLAPVSAGDTIKRFLFNEGPWIVSTLALFFIAKLFVVDVYQIPSGSMMPTLVTGDRIVVRKFATARAEERWRIWTFQREPKTYVKRMVGLPGERIAIHGGDIYINGVIAEKPVALNQTLRRPLGHWDFRRAEDVRATWRRTSSGGTHRWVWDGGRLSPDWRPDHQTSSYAIPLLDAYATLHAERPKDGRLAITLARMAKTSGETAWTFELAPEGARVIERVTAVSVPGHAPVPTQERVLWKDKRGGDAHGTLAMTLALIDGNLSAAVEDLSWKGRVNAPRHGLRFEVAATEASLHSFALDADQHWSSVGVHAVTDIDDDPTTAGHTLGEHSFFFLGDNTTNSGDSRIRSLGDVHRSELIAPVIFKVWPPSDLGVPK